MAQSLRAAATATAELPSRPLRILVVDDNRDAADMLCVLLRMWGHDCRAAYDGERGLAAARDFLPECLVLDASMPRMDGFTLARRVRAEPDLADATLVLLSAYSDDAHARRAREAGFDYQLTKPAPPCTLQRLLEDLDIRIETPPPRP